MKSWAEKASAGVNSVVEGIVACLMLALVLDVWLGVVDRYYFHWQLPWPEEFARYLMIWAAMLGVSCGVAGREHIGLTAFIDQLPKPLRRASLVAMDLLALALFLYVLWFGIAFANGGGNPAGSDLWPQPAPLLRCNPCFGGYCFASADFGLAARSWHPWGTHV